MVNAARTGPKPPKQDSLAALEAQRALAVQLAMRPLSTENLTSTWGPPEWEEVVEWWDEFVKHARRITGKKYR